MSNDIINSMVFSLWIVVIGILCVGIVLCYQQQRKSKSSFYFGLVALCVGFIAGRIFKLIAQFGVGEPSPLIEGYDKSAYFLENIYFFVLFCIILSIGAISYSKPGIVGLKFYVFWIMLIVLCVIGTYAFIFWVTANIGPLPQFSNLTTEIAIFECGYVVFSWIGYLILIFCIEKVSKDLFNTNKSKYFFAISSIIGIIIAIMEYIAASIGIEYLVMISIYLMMIFFMISMAGLLLVFLSMAVKSDGEIRRNSLYICVGHLCLVMTFAIGSREGTLMYGSLMSISPLSVLISPILHIIGLLFYFRGLLPIIFRQRKS